MDGSKGAIETPFSSAFPPQPSVSRRRGGRRRQLVVVVVLPDVPPVVAPWSVVPVVPLVVPVVPLVPELVDELSSFLPQADSDNPTTSASTAATDFVVIVIREPPGCVDCELGKIDAIELWPRDKKRAIPLNATCLQPQGVAGLGAVLLTATR